jgi:ankyrin repeat protein
MFFLCICILNGLANASLYDKAGSLWYHTKNLAQWKSHGDQFVGYCSSKLSEDAWAKQAFVDFLHSGVDPDIRDSQNRSCLMAAAATGELKTAGRLLSQNEQHDAQMRVLNGQDSEGNTALHYAVMRADADVLGFISFLVTMGANPKATNDAGLTPFQVDSPVLREAIFKGCKSGASPGFLDSVTENPALLEQVKELSGRRHSCLILAVVGGTAEGLLKALPDLLDPGYVDGNGANALNYAVERDAPIEVLHELVEAGVDANVIPTTGWKALEMAVQKGNIGAIELLLPLTSPLETGRSLAQLAASAKDAKGRPSIPTDLLDRIKRWEQAGLPPAAPKPIVPAEMREMANNVVPSVRGLGKKVSGGLTNMFKGREWREAFDREAAEAVAKERRR